MGYNKDLAIVIPAYKAAFFEAALTSLAMQTDKNFRVYVGDDASPEDLEAICRRSALSNCYHRFPQNLGRVSLAAHWDRCVRLSQEDWVWLFSDDDLAEPGCVAAFRAALSDTEAAYSVYHFDVVVIDKLGKRIREGAAFGEVVIPFEFALKRLQNRLNSYAVEYIFSRRRFEEAGGFVKFPAAWCSDDASWISFSDPNGIYSMKGARVYWRRSDVNVSSSASPFGKDKLIASAQYLSWLDRRFCHDVSGPLRNGVRVLRRHYRQWFYAQLQQFTRPASPIALAQLAFEMSRSSRTSLLRNLYAVGRTAAKDILVRAGVWRSVGPQACKGTQFPSGKD